MPQERQEKRIDQLTVLSEVTGTEELPISDGGVAKRVTVETLLSAATVNVDTTLTQAGRAADAKAVGDAIAGLSGTINEIGTLLGGEA